MTLTPEQRYTMYCIMMQEIEDGYDAQRRGLCDLYEELTDECPIEWVGEYQLKDVLPELYAKKTTEIVHWFSSWFCNIAERITALQQCIEELEKQLYS